MSIRAAAPFCLAVAAWACASTPKNYLDPDTPLYQGSYGTPPLEGQQIRVVTFNVSKRDIGPEILSPWPMDDRRKIRLPHFSRVSKHARSVVSARVTIDGRTLRAYSVHFGTLLGLSPSQRKEQLQAVVDDARAVLDPVIVGGDFNSKGLAERMAGQGYEWATQDIGKTWKIFSFDHILARGLKSTGAPSAGVARDVKGASDHFAARATFAAR